tara:strand:+ start:195 stop:389 length:195 start_codon:yes stop_codon:yes gene_type:complete
MLAKLFCFFSGVILSVGIMNPQIYEKALIDFENTVYPIIECNAQSLANLDKYFFYPEKKLVRIL